MLTQLQYHEFVANIESGMFNLFLLVIVGCFALYPARNVLKRISIPTDIVVSLPFVLVIATILRIPHMTATFWYDETFSVGIAQMPINDLFTAVQADVHPPLYYLILWGVGRVFGYAEWVMRTPSLISGLASIVIMYELVFRLTKSKSHAQMSAFLLAIIPAHIQYSTEARSYMLLTFFVFLAVFALIEFKPGLFAVSTAVIPLLQPHGYIYWLVFIVVWLVRFRRKRIIAILPSLITVMAWLPFMLNQSNDVANGFWLAPLTWQGVPKFLIEMTVGNLSGQLSMFGVYIPVTAICVLSLWGSRKWITTSTKGLIVFSMIIGVPMIVAIISFVWRPIYLTRALLPCAMLSLILWSMLLENSTPMRKFYRSVFIPALLLATIMTSFKGVNNDIRSFFAECEGADYVYSTSTATGIMALYYSPIPIRLWTGANDINQYLTPEAKQAFGFIEADIDQLAGVICVPTQINPHTTKHELEELRSFSQSTFETQIMYSELPLFYFVIYKVRL